jgi:2-hydroxychromene-2-carboxylate isomerase
LIDAIRKSKVSEADSLVKAVQEGKFEGESQRKQLEESTDLAVQRGTPGVPGFWVPDEVWRDRDGKQHTGRLYWGQDRMQFLEAVLLAKGEALLGIKPKAYSWG